MRWGCRYGATGLTATAVRAVIALSPAFRGLRSLQRSHTLRGIASLLRAEAQGIGW